MFFYILELLVILNKQHKHRYHTDIQFRLRSNFSTSLGTALRKQNIKKTKSTLKYLPHTVPEYKTRLESTFEPWMNWKNHGNEYIKGFRTWHIDHIIPLSAFDLRKDEEIAKAFALENLQALESHENMSKKNKMPDEWETYKKKVKKFQPLPFQQTTRKETQCQILQIN